MIKLTLPIYHYTSRRDKKPKLIGMNGYRNWHYQVSNNIKQYYHDLVMIEHSKNKFKKIDGEYEINYIVYFKNPKSDLGNIVSVIDKFFNDALQELKLVKEDNTKYYKRMTARVGGIDKDNPRIEIEVYKL